MSNSVDYKVGFCHPPLETRFKSGQSGNPRGRPRGSMNTLRLLEMLINKKIVATIDGRQLRISKKQAMFLRLINNAVSGDVNSIKFLTQMIEKLDVHQEAIKAASENSITPTDREILDEYAKEIKHG